MCGCVSVRCSQVYAVTRESNHDQADEHPGQRTRRCGGSRGAQRAGSGTLAISPVAASRLVCGEDQGSRRFCWRSYFLKASLTRLGTATGLGREGQPEQECRNGGEGEVAGGQWASCPGGVASSSPTSTCLALGPSSRSCRRSSTNGARPPTQGPVVVVQRGEQPRPVRREHQVGQRPLPDGPSPPLAPGRGLPRAGLDQHVLPACVQGGSRRIGEHNVVNAGVQIAEPPGCQAVCLVPSSTVDSNRRTREDCVPQATEEGSRDYQQHRDQPLAGGRVRLPR